MTSLGKVCSIRESSLRSQNSSKVFAFVRACARLLFLNRRGGGRGGIRAKRVFCESFGGFCSLARFTPAMACPQSWRSRLAEPNSTELGFVVFRLTPPCSRSQDVAVRRHEARPHVMCSETMCEGSHTRRGSAARNEHQLGERFPRGEEQKEMVFPPFLLTRSPILLASGRSVPLLKQGHIQLWK